jgi:hypothetical protein
MEFILYILFTQVDTGVIIDSQRFANEASCNAAKSEISALYRETRAKTPQTKSQMKLTCIPADITSVVTSE